MLQPRCFSLSYYSFLSHSHQHFIVLTISVHFTLILLRHNHILKFSRFFSSIFFTVHLSLPNKRFSKSLFKSESLWLGIFLPFQRSFIPKTAYYWFTPYSFHSMSLCSSNTYISSPLSVCILYISLILTRFKINRLIRKNN